MSLASHIEWTDATWNPVTGCTKISPGCKHCYAERFAKRLQLMGKARYEQGFDLTLHDDLVTLPLRWKQPRKVFVNSMSDLFHPDVPLEFIQRVFVTMEKAPQHLFQVLTKRGERLREVAPDLPWPDNVWMGVSIETMQYAKRADDLRTVDAAVRFLSCEPLLGSLADLDISDVHWVIAGGESGPKNRPAEIQWFRELRDKCVEAGTPYFFKQWGGTNKKKSGRTLDERTWDEFPRPHSSEKPGGQTSGVLHLEMPEVVHPFVHGGVQADVPENVLIA